MGYYFKFKFCDGASYTSKSGKDGVTKRDMSILHQANNYGDRQMSRDYGVEELPEIISLELITEDGWQDLDVAVIVEDRDEYHRLHNAITNLAQEQQALIQAVYFEGMSIRAYARQVGQHHNKIRRELAKIYGILKNNL